MGELHPRPQQRGKVHTGAAARPRRARRPRLRSPAASGRWRSTRSGAVRGRGKGRGAGPATSRATTRSLASAAASTASATAQRARKPVYDGSAGSSTRRRCASAPPGVAASELVRARARSRSWPACRRPRRAEAWESASSASARPRSGSPRRPVSAPEAARPATGGSGWSVSRATTVASCAAARVALQGAGVKPSPGAADERGAEHPVPAAGAQPGDRVVADHDAAVELTNEPGHRPRRPAATRWGARPARCAASQAATSGPCSSGAASPERDHLDHLGRAGAGDPGAGDHALAQRPWGRPTTRPGRRLSAAPATRAGGRRRAGSMRSRWASNHAGSGARWRAMRCSQARRGWSVGGEG